MSGETYVSELTRYPCLFTLPIARFAGRREGETVGFVSDFLASGSVFGEGKGRVGSGCGRIGREGCGKD